MGWNGELWFVRNFLDVFAYGKGPKDTPKSEVKRHCNLAVAFVLDGRTYQELALKCGISPLQAEILYDYGLQCVARRYAGDALNNFEEYDEDLNGDLADTDLQPEPANDPEWFELPDDDDGSAFRPINSDLDSIMTTLHGAS